MLSKIENIEMKKIRSFVLFVIFNGFLITSSVMFNGCRPDDVNSENKGELCDTCVIVYNHAILPAKTSPTGIIKNLDFQFHPHSKPG